MVRKWFGIFLLQLLAATDGEWVRNADSSIIEEIQQNPSNSYLIQFHAPWCGHCRKFESTYEEIAKEVYDLSDSVEQFRNLHIVRLDATVYTDVANHYDIRGYPTIKFIHQSQILTFENERTKSAVLEFLKRVNGPALRWISSVEQFNEIRREYEVFFLLATTTDDHESNDSLLIDYENLARQYLSQAYFYATNDSLVQQTYFSQYPSDSKSQIFAVKLEGSYLYQPDENHQNVEEFFTKENLASFPEVSTGNIRELILTKKILVIYAFDDQIEIEHEKQKRNEYKTQIRHYVLEHISAYRTTFQFAWSNDLDLLSHIAVWTLDEPLVFLYDSNRHKYGIYPLPSTVNPNLPLESILDYLIAHSSQVIQFTGDNWWKRSVRPFWELYRTIIAMFIEAPMMSMFVIGVPASVLSIVCYCICCLPNESSMDERREFLRERDDSDDDEPVQIESPSTHKPKSTIEKKYD